VHTVQPVVIHHHSCSYHSKVCHTSVTWLLVLDLSQHGPEVMRVQEGCQSCKGLGNSHLITLSLACS
jgi:hypothetical protein